MTTFRHDNTNNLIASCESVLRIHGILGSETCRDLIAKVREQQTTIAAMTGHLDTISRLMQIGLHRENVTNCNPCDCEKCAPELYGLAAWPTSGTSEDAEFSVTCANGKRFNEIGGKRP